MADTTILVVDDEPRIRRVLRTTLSGNGYDVILAEDGQEAIEMVMREHPDLILLDANMPGMSGLEACSKIRLFFPGPIIMVTVRNSQQDKILALDSGADDYVVKTLHNGGTPGTHPSGLATVQFGRTASEVRKPAIECRC
jgi:DNA-binding response OmpR family regulator